MPATAGKPQSSGTTSALKRSERWQVQRGSALDEMRMHVDGEGGCRSDKRVTCFCALAPAVAMAWVEVPSNDQLILPELWTRLAVSVSCESDDGPFFQCRSDGEKERQGAVAIEFRDSAASAISVTTRPWK